MRLILIILTLLVVQTNHLDAQEQIKPREYEPSVLEPLRKGPEIDGLLTDSVWKQSGWTRDFVQREPFENQPPGEQTSFSVVFGDRHMYIAIKCDHQSEREISRRLSRRDIVDGDWVEIQLDSYHDRQSCFVFTVSAAGVKADRIISLDGEVEDLSWNPVWQAGSHIDASGWTVEISIPLSQLRFSNDRNQAWGMQVLRRIFYKDEIDVWQRIPLDASGWVNNFGLLTNVRSLDLPRQLEIQPYIVSAINTFEREEDNPYRSQYEKSLKAGLDGKIGLSNDFVIDFTINPDFGQVEADPSDISLNGFQLFFNEQRPFFVENKQIFDYAFSSSSVGNTFGNDNLFYSRRLGRPPHRNYSPAADEYVKSPDNTTILGAVKLSGKTSRGLSIGVLESLTSRAYAQVSREGTQRRETIEPFTNYLVTRVQQDLNNRDSYIGAIYTQTHRSLKDPLDFLHRSAYTGGVDFLHRWKSRSWYLGGNVIASNVNGSAYAIERTQNSIVHLFQREGSIAVLDTTRTSLTGSGGNLKLGKAGGGHMTFEGGVTWRSPSLELNDMGFLRQSDDIRQYFALNYRTLQPDRIFRNAQISYKHWLAWDFAGHLNRMHFQMEISSTFLNNWNIQLGGYTKPLLFNNYFLQGGPSIRIPMENGCWWSISTDRRNRLTFNHSVTLGMAGEGGHWIYTQWGIRYQPSNRFDISVDAEWSKISNYPQYINTFNQASNPIFLAAGIDQETIRFIGRLNYSLNPNLSLQYFIQPYSTRGLYNHYRQVVDAGTRLFGEQFHYLDAEEVSPNGEGQLLVSGVDGGLTDLLITDPDFSLNELRANFVIRWEYKPGSEIFLIWNKSFSKYGRPQARIFRHFQNTLRGEAHDNIFLVKYTYRFIR